MLRHLPVLCCLILPSIGIYELSLTISWVIILPYLLCISIATYASYWQDKRKAEKALWRISERTLHILELLGGWPAAYLAQQIHRHKTSKRSFRIIFWSIVALHQFLALEYIIDGRITHSIITHFQ